MKHDQLKKYGRIGAAAVLLTAAGLYYGFSGRSDETILLKEENYTVTFETMKPSSEYASPDEADPAGESVSEMTTCSLCYVHVCGEVKNPGVYELPAGSRVFEAVEAAGGLTDQAAGASLNQAGRVEDGMQIVIPSREEAEEFEKIQREETLGLVNLNTATKEQLMELSGIGETRAEAIISYREEHGRFQAIEEIMNVPGIKEAAYKKIKDKITI